MEGNYTMLIDGYLFYGGEFSSFAIPAHASKTSTGIFFLIFSHLFFFPPLMSHICPRKNVFTGTCINVLAVHDVQ